MALVHGLPTGIVIVRGPQHGVKAYAGRRYLGWLYHTSDGTWVAEDARGLYLAADFATLADAIAALMGVPDW